MSSGECTVRVLPMHAGKTVWERDGVCKISTVARAGGVWSQLSPFLLGPCELYEYTPPTHHCPDSYCMDSGWLWARNVENAWQYSKVYEHHVGRNKRGDVNLITDGWWEWATKGWANDRAVRYPMGKGAKPLFSYWDGECLPYVEARKVIYGPLYAEAVRKTKAWKKLKVLYRNMKEIVLLDFDAYDHRALKMSLTDVLNNPHRKMGHAFVLAMLLTGDPALDQMELR